MGRVSFTSNRILTLPFGFISANGVNQTIYFQNDLQFYSLSQSGNCEKFYHSNILQYLHELKF